MKIAIVILNWNGRDLLEKFLPSVIDCSLEDAEVYVADNNSTDESISFLQEKYPQVKIIQNKINGGYAKGYNDALKHIDADIYALVNSDIEVTKNWLKPIKLAFDQNDTTAIIQPKLLDFKNKSKFEYAGAAGGFVDFMGYPFCRGRIFMELENDQGQFNDISDIFWASGACFFIKSDIYHELGGFDEEYFAHQEEIDLCWRVQNAGYKIKYVGASEVYHVGGETYQNIDELPPQVRKKVEKALGKAGNALESDFATTHSSMDRQVRAALDIGIKESRKLGQFLKYLLILLAGGLIVFGVLYFLGHLK